MARRDPLYENKLAAGLLIAALIVFGVPLFIDRAVLGNHALRRLEDKEVTVILVKELAFNTFYENANARRGLKQTAVCQSCHSFEQGADHSIGPNLWRVVDREIASIDSFPYSSALRKIQGSWTPATLNLYLADTQEFAPGSMMVLRVADAQDRADIIKYLSTLSDESPAN